MPLDPNNPNFTVSQDNLDLVNRKERESRSVGGMTSSWTAPPNPELVPPDKMKLILESQSANEKQVDKDREFVSRKALDIPRPTQRLVTIPPQAMKAFKALLNLFEVVQVNLTETQAKMLLESLEKQPTPKNMMDAKAIFNLMEILGQ